MNRKSAAIFSIAIVLIATLIVIPVFAIAPLLWLCEATVVIADAPPRAVPTFPPPALVALASSANLARSSLIALFR